MITLKMVTYKVKIIHKKLKNGRRKFTVGKNWERLSPMIMNQLILLIIS